MDITCLNTMSALDINLIRVFAISENGVGNNWVQVANLNIGAKLIVLTSHGVG